MTPPSVRDSAATGRFGRPLAALVVAWALAVVAWLSPGLVVPDGAALWSYLPSLLLRGDLLLFDEWQAAGMAPGGRFLHEWVTPSGHLANHWTCGAAVAWSPGFLLGDVAARVVPVLEAFPRDGFRLPHVAGGLVVNAAAALAAALLGRAAARRVLPGAPATLAAFGVLFGSPLVHYGLRGGLMSHAVGAAASAAILLLALRLRERIDAERLASAGLACGVAFAVRPQLAALVALPLLVVPLGDWRAAARESRARLLLLPLAALLGAAPQLLVGRILYGSWLGVLSNGPSPEGRPFAAFERAWTWEPYLSAWHGLLPWTPFAALALVGLVLLARDDRRLALAAGVVVLSQAAAVALLDRPFWGAHAFGQRRLDGLTGLLVVGAAAALARLPRRVGVALTLACSAWTTGLSLASWSRLDLNDPVSWPDLVAAWASAVMDPAAWARPLAAVPPEARPAFVAAVLGVALPGALAAWLLVRLGPRGRLAAAAAWLLAATLVVAAAGRRSAELLPAWTTLAERHRSLGPMAGSVDARVGMLRREAAWFRARGDADEANRVEARADALARELVAAVERAGFPPEARPALP